MEWKPAFGRLASCPNVNVKLGGIMAINGFGFERHAKPPSSQELADVLGPYHRYLIELFGANRCMFESNFPVDKQGCSYTVLFNAFQRIADEAGWSSAERSELFSGSARRFYRLTQ